MCVFFNAIVLGALIPWTPQAYRFIHQMQAPRPKKIPKIQANFQWAWRKTAIVLAAIRSYQTVTNEPSASSTVDG